MSPGSVASSKRNVVEVLVPPALATPLGSSQSLPLVIGGLLIREAGVMPPGLRARVIPVKIAVDLESCDRIGQEPACRERRRRCGEHNRLEEQ